MSARWRRALLPAGLVLGVVLTGCGAMEDNARGAELCAQYDELVLAADELRQVDPDRTTADELRATAETFRENLNQVQAVAEGRLDTAASNLEATLDDVRAAATAASDEARETLIPQWKEDLQAVAEAWAVLQQVIANQCDAEPS